MNNGTVLNHFIFNEALPTSYMILFVQKDYARDLMLLSLQITCSIKVNDEFGLQVGNYLWFIFMTVKQFGLFFQAKKLYTGK